ncbi:response regulator [Agrobacterium tumefaciens]|uniref:response regulator n=1 Tax=Agrobacterium tumefaciens TaxID=358 RepID=UPI003BA30182
MTEAVTAAKAKDVSDPAVIAIIEDDLAFRDALSELLQVFGLACCAFDRAETFIDAYKDGIFDCAISDIRLPGSSGLDLLRRVRALGSNLPFVMISSTSDQTIRQQAADAGATAFLSKPFSSDVLAEYLRIALGRASLPGDEPSSGGTGYV